MAKAQTECPICKRPATQTNSATGDYLDISCADCGEFQVSPTFRTLVSDLPVATRQQSLLRARIRARYGSLPLVTSYDLP